MWTLCNQQSLKVPFSEIVATIFHAFTTTLCGTAIFVSFALILATAVQCTYSTSNLFSGLIIFGLCGKEKIDPAKVVFVFLCITGVVLVLQPWQGEFMDKPDFSNHIPAKSNCSSAAEILCKLLMTRKRDNLDHCDDQHLVNLNQLADSCKENGSAPMDQVHVNTTTLCHNLSTCWLAASFNDDNKTIQQTYRSRPEVVQILLWQIPARYVATTGVVIAGFAGLMLTLILLIVKHLSDHQCRSLFWAFTTCLVCSLLLTFILEDPVWPTSLSDSVCVTIHCLASASTWFGALHSFKHVSATILSVIFSTSIVLFLIPQYTILASVMPGHRNWMEVLGVILVLLGSILGSLYEMSSTTKEKWMSTCVTQTNDASCLKRG